MKLFLKPVFSLLLVFCYLSYGYFLFIDPFLIHQNGAGWNKFFSSGKQTSRITDTSENTIWMTKSKYGIFMHYQYRILLGYGKGTTPEWPDKSLMSSSEWNNLVDGFDVKGFARQMSKTKIGWVIFCIDDGVFGWQCAPNKTFNDYTGYAPGEKCSRRDLIMDLADALTARGVKLICYFAGLGHSYMQEPKILAGLKDSLRSQDADKKAILPEEVRRRRTEILKEYADRYKEKIAGWWFDGMADNFYSSAPNDWSTINTIVRSVNPEAVIAFSHGRNKYKPVLKGLDDYTGGDTWTKQDLLKLTPGNWPPQDNILWHGKIYCGNIYHGLGDGNLYGDQELIDWIRTCSDQGGICTMDWLFDPKTGLIKDFGMKQMKAIKKALED
jgi:hypothetical protein